MQQGMRESKPRGLEDEIFVEEEVDVYRTIGLASFVTLLPSA